MHRTIRGRSSAIAVLFVATTGACDSERGTPSRASAVVSPLAGSNEGHPHPSRQISSAPAGSNGAAVAATGGGLGANARCVTHADCRADLVCVFPGDTNCNAAGGGVCRKATECNAGCGAAQCRSSNGKDCRCFSCGGHGECFEGNGCYWCVAYSQTSDRG